MKTSKNNLDSGFKNIFWIIFEIALYSFAVLVVNQIIPALSFLSETWMQLIVKSIGITLAVLIANNLMLKKAIKFDSSIIYSIAVNVLLLFLIPLLFETVYYPANDMVRILFSGLFLYTMNKAIKSLDVAVQPLDTNVNNQNKKVLKFLLWTTIHSLSAFLMSLISPRLELTGYLTNLAVTGFGVALFALFARGIISHAKIKINANLIYWTFVDTLALLIMSFIFQNVYISSEPWANFLFTGVGLTIAGKIAKTVKFSSK
jgi:hypothetical protein